MMDMDLKISKTLFFRIISRLLFFILNVVLIFISAGRIDYWQGWVFSAIYMVLMIISTIILLHNMDLFKERLKPGPNVKPWDKLFISLYIPLTTLIMIVSSMDAGRQLWTREFPIYAYIIGYLFLITGLTIILIAINANNFFSSMVRIQTDRGHIVIQDGLYQYIRHPGYVGMIFAFIGMPLVFGSLWGLLVSFCMLAIIIVRTYFEDKILQKELEGYTNYCQKTKYRLVPGVW